MDKRKFGFGGRKWQNGVEKSTMKRAKCAENKHFSFVISFFSYLCTLRVRNSRSKSGRQNADRSFRSGEKEFM